MAAGAAAAALTPDRFISLTLQCAATHNSQRVTLATHVDDFIKQHRLESDPAGASSIRTLVYELDRVKPLLARTVAGLYAAHAGSLARSDRPLLELFTMLAVVQLHHPRSPLPLSAFRRLCFCRPHSLPAFIVLLSFLYDSSALSMEENGWLAQQWQTIYDERHVRDSMVEPMLRVKPQIDALIQEMKDRGGKGRANEQKEADDGSEGEGGKRSSRRRGSNASIKQATVPTPFNLTQPKVKQLPEPPICMTQTFTANAVPPTTHDPQLSLKELEKAAKERRQMMAAATAAQHAAARKPRLATDARAQLTHVSELKTRAEREKAEAAATQPVSVRPPPPVVPVAPPKLTTAAILREELLFRRRAEAKAKELEQFASALRDETEFRAWQREQELLEDKRRAEEREKRKLDAAAAQQAALDAMITHAREKHEAVVAAKEELRAIEAAREAQMQAQIEAKQQLVNKIVEERQGVAVAIAAVASKKAENAEQIAQVKAEALQAKQRAYAEELEKKKALIKQIQAMEQLAAARARKPKEIDVTASSGLGLMSEMSTVELEARLRTMQQAEEEALREKREQINKAKQAKAEALLDMQRAHARMRREMSEEFRTKQQHRAEATAKVAQATKEKAVQDAEVLKQHLAVSAQEKRAEALRLAKELKAKSIANAFYAHRKQQAAAERERDMARALARREKDAAMRTRELEKGSSMVATRAEADRIKLAKAKARATALQRKATDALLEEHRADGRELDEEIMATQKIQMKAIREEVRHQMKQHRERNPYAKSIADREAKRAERLAAAKNGGTGSNNHSKTVARGVRLSGSSSSTIEFGMDGDGPGSDDELGALTAEMSLKAEVHALAVEVDEEDGEESAREATAADEEMEAKQQQQPQSTPQPATSNRVTAAAKRGSKLSTTKTHAATQKRIAARA